MLVAFGCPKIVNEGDFGFNILEQMHASARLEQGCWALFPL
jgi:hypothetical protein